MGGYHAPSQTPPHLRESPFYYESVVCFFRWAVAVASMVHAVPAPALAEIPLKTSLVTGKPVGTLAVGGRLAVDLHAEFMMSRTYESDVVLNWYNCGYSGGGGDGGAVTEVGGNFGDFGFHVSPDKRPLRYPRATRGEGVPAAAFNGSNFLKANFPIEPAIVQRGRLAIEVWLRTENARTPGALLGWQSPDGPATSAPLVLPPGLGSDNRWRHLVVNRSSDGETWYLDGKKIPASSRATDIAPGHILVLGGECSERPSFRGAIAAVRVHDEALSELEIAHNFAGGPMLGTELHDWWRTDEEVWWSENSAHFRHAIDRKEMSQWTHQQREDFEKRKSAMFRLAELAYHCYSERLALRTSVVSRKRVERGDGIKYRTPIQPTKGGNYMGVDERFGWSCQGPGFINPHELVHGWDVMTGNMAGNYWEAHANFPQTYIGVYQTIPLLAMESSGFPCMGRTYYHDRLMFEHLAQTPEYGPMFISKMWFDGPTRRTSAPDPWQTFERINPFRERTLADEYTRMAMRNVTCDFQTFAEAFSGPGNTPLGNDGLLSETNRYRTIFDANLRNSEQTLLRWGRVLLSAVPHEPGWWRTPKQQAPQQLGWNICPLTCQPGEVTAVLSGYADSARGGDWRAGFVGVTRDAKPVYGPVFKPGEAARFRVTDELRELYLVVCATPTKVLEIPMTGDFRSFEQRQFPYKVQLSGAVPRDVLESQPAVGPGAPHGNGGGFVSAAATVDPTAFVAPGARVLGKSSVLGRARVEDQATVRDATVKDDALLSGHALVHEGAVVQEHAMIRDYAVVAKKTTVSGSARILEHARLASGKTCGGAVTAKGISHIYGGSQHGTALLDGFYAKANDISRGAWFTWSWGTGQNPGERDEDLGGLYADYTFDQPHDSLVLDALGAGWGYLAGGAFHQPVIERALGGWPEDEVVQALEHRRQDTGEHYVQRFFAHLRPPATGDYTFWISGDDSAEFWIGEADADDAATLACMVSKPVVPLAFTQEPSQKSVPFHLEAGRTYPVAVMHQQVTHGQHMAVAWTHSGLEKPQLLQGSLLWTERQGGAPGVRRRIWRNTQSIKNIPWTPGYDPQLRPVTRHDGCVRLNGVDAFVELPRDLADLQEAAYSVEFSWDGTPRESCLFEFFNKAHDGLKLSVSPRGEIRFDIRKGTATGTVTAPAVRAKVWTTVEVWVNGNEIALSVNGDKISSSKSPVQGPADLRATDCYLGREREGFFFCGALSRFQVRRPIDR